MGQLSRKGSPDRPRTRLVVTTRGTRPDSAVAISRLPLASLHGPSRSVHSALYEALMLSARALSKLSPLGSDRTAPRASLFEAGAVDDGEILAPRAAVRLWSHQLTEMLTTSGPDARSPRRRRASWAASVVPTRQPTM